MPGLMDFLGGIFGGQQQAPPPQQGLTNPDLYSQAPPEFKLPFAYKLAMLGSSINQSYGGRGGMDVGSLAKAYLENQAAQYEYAQTQAERKRKIELVRKFAEKTGNQALMDAVEADPDAVMKHVLGVEAEKAKPREDKFNEVGGGLYNTTKREWEIPQPAPPQLPSFDSGAPAPVAPSMPAVAAPDHPLPAVAPVAGVKSDSSAEPPVDVLAALSPADKQLYQENESRIKWLQGAVTADPANAKDFMPAMTAAQNAKQELVTKAEAAAAKKAEPQAFAEGTLVKQEGKPDFTVPKTSTEMADFNTISNWPPEKRAAYEAHLDNIKSPEARLLRLYNSSTPEDQAKLKMLIQSGSGATAVDEWAAFKKKDQEFMAETFQEYAKQAVPAQNILADMVKLRELLKTAPQGLTMDAIITNYKSGYSASGDSVLAVVNNIIPHLRQEGSGSQSDLEFQGLKDAMVGVTKHPQANQLILEAFETKAKLQMERANIVDQQRRHKITPEQAVEQINEINNRSVMSPALKAMVDEELGKQRQAAEAAKEAPITGRPKLDSAIEKWGQ